MNVSVATLTAPPPPESFTVQTKDGLSLFVARYGKTEPKGRALLIVHGLGEHGGRYNVTATALLAAFSEVYVLDLRGHGRSAGTRGYVPSFESYLEDLDEVVSAVRQRLPSGSKKSGYPLYLLGHSMGGLISLNYLQTRPQCGFAGAIISAPLLGVALKVPMWKEKMGKVLLHTLSKIQLHNEINPSFVSHDPAVVEAYVNDRLVHQKITPRLYYGMTKAMDEVKANTAALPCPTLFLIPLEDMIVDSNATKAFVAALNDKHKSVKEYPGFYHEVLNETRKDQAYGHIIEWAQNV